MPSSSLDITVQGYQLGWKAKSLICCRGRFITGPPISLSGLYFYTMVVLIGATYYVMLTEVGPMLELGG